MLPRLIYSLLLMLLAPLVWLWLLWRARATLGSWQPWAAERFGAYPQPWDGQRPVWVHAASVGEVRAAKPLIRALVLRGERVLLTHFTPTGRAEGQRVLEQEIRSGQVRQQWLPYDFAGATRRFIRHYSPRLAILIEREVWPNLVHAANVHRVPVVLASARLSEKSFRRMARVNRVFGGLLRDTYRGIDLALAQSQDDAQRLFDSGVAHVQVVGNLKFDMTLPHVAVEAGRHWHQQLARPVVAIASTREGEDGPFVQLIKGSIDAAQSAGATGAAKPLFLLIPRHPQRFDEAARLLDASGCRYARWSVLRDDPYAQSSMQGTDVVLGDTMGEMPFFYSAADIAIVGGSFERHGGQNFIEACAVGVAVIVGPHTYNFADAVSSALRAQAVVQVANAQAAFDQVHQWLTEPELARQLGQAASAWVTNHVGATERILQAISELEAEPDPEPTHHR